MEDEERDLTHLSTMKRSFFFKNDGAATEAVTTERGKNETAKTAVSENGGVLETSIDPEAWMEEVEKVGKALGGPVYPDEDDL